MTNCFEKAQELKKAEGYIKLERGFAIIPLPGIDVPFHSCYLWAGVMPFGACKLRRSVMITFHSIRFQTFPRRSTLRNSIQTCSLGSIFRMIAKPVDVSRQLVYCTTKRCPLGLTRFRGSGIKRIGLVLHNDRSLPTSFLSSFLPTTTSSLPPCAGSIHETSCLRNTTSKDSLRSRLLPH
jgi:hypothetical protein